MDIDFYEKLGEIAIKEGQKQWNCLRNFVKFSIPTELLLSQVTDCGQS